ncbi:MAG: hypothetical protein WBQ55_09830, partial [Xanthobacteraceae bacterium]
CGILRVLHDAPPSGRRQISNAISLSRVPQEAEANMIGAYFSRHSTFSNISTIRSAIETCVVSPPAALSTRFSLRQFAPPCRGGAASAG